MRDFDIPYIEEASELNLRVDDLVFNYVQDVQSEHVKETEVFDLNIENQHNYITELGVVHNGGGIA